MKSETSVSVVFSDVVPALRQSAAIVALVGAALFASSALAESAVRFSGSVVTATCNLQPQGQAGRGDGQRLELAPGVNVQVDNSRNACAGQATPFVARYTPVQVATPADTPRKAGVVTVTYQ